jgi:hypothetical protein
LIRATEFNDRLDLLTDIELETDDEQIIRFCENYRMLLGAKDRKKRLASDRRVQALIDRANKEKSDEVDGEESEPHWAQLEAGEWF